MRVLVTGGTGYLGSAIVRALLGRGHQPVVFSRTASRSGLSGTLVDGDVRDVSALTQAAQGVDAICHTAALVSVWRRRAADFDDVNVQGLRNALAAVRACGAERFVYTSSFLALPPSDAREPLVTNDYQRTKALALGVARDAMATGTPMVITVPGVVYGPGAATEGNLIAALIRDHLHHRLPGIAGADRCWSYAWVDDVAEAHVDALERGTPGSEYVLGGENAPQMRVFEIVRDVTGRALPRRIPFVVAAAAGVVDEAMARVTNHTPRLTRSTVEIFRHDWSLNSARSIAELSYRIRPLEEGVRDTIASLG